MTFATDRAGETLVRCLLLAVLLLFAALLLPRAGQAIEFVDLAKLGQQRDLGPVLGTVETGQRSLEVELPGATPAARSMIMLMAQGPGPRFNWLVAAMSNSADGPREAVISLPHQRFAGSGFLLLKPAGLRLFSAKVSGDARIDLMEQPGETAYAVSLPARSSAAIAFELVDANPAAVTIWQRDAFDSRKDYLSFFRGALLGVSVLMAVTLFVLYGFRARALFPVAGGFALAATAFMMLEAGHLPELLSDLDIPGYNLQVLRACVEGLMAAFLLLLLGSLSELQRVSRVAGTLLMSLGGLAFALPIYGFADPMMAASLARGLFAATAVLGFLLIFSLWRKGEVKAETALTSWGAILIWTILAIAAAFAANPGAVMSGLLQAGLCAVVLVIGFTLVHHAFAQGFFSRHFFREAGRHQLAMAGARAYVWDWQPSDGELHVSPEISRALGQPAAGFESAASEAIMEIMHPGDRSAYLAAVEQAASGGRAPIECQFRLSHSEGGYRWFELRARAIVGEGTRVQRCIGTLVDVTDAKLTEERLLQDAVYDVVTGLPNRALFIDRLERVIASWKPEQAGGLFVLLVDLDRFKIMNEVLGHEVGDAMLSIVGRRIKSETGISDSTARLPGDKFAVLFHEIPGKRDVVSFADVLTNAVARPIKIDHEDFVLTATIGIARYSGDDLSAEMLLKNASIALYEARRNGSAPVELFNASMVDERAELMILETELRRAVERGEFEVHYQPIARLADMQLAGFEALVRWRHPAMGLLAPESFIALAEETGMIRDIGRIVLNEAGRQLGIWQRSYRRSEPVFVAVNLSSSQLIEPGLLDDVKQIIHREGLLRGSFKIEVTESLVMQYPERAVQILERLQELGVGLSCDDFGTGYSSLSSLRKLPFDTLKVDRSFIAHEGNEPRAEIILNAIIAMGHDLGLAVVAEGIESQEQVNRLGALGCDYGQGFFIGKPITARQVNDALAGLPFAFSSERTAISWLWGRSQKDPPPEPRRGPLTGRDVTTPEVQLPPEGAEQAEAVSPGPAPGQRPPVKDTGVTLAPEAQSLPPDDPAGPAPDSAEEPGAGPAPAEAQRREIPPPPAPRRRKGQRRPPVLGFEE
jgi:diguanylate cyclase (GGDEF)-like protein/PAS domain S-box-containing protein